jgi:hypothetical protein
MHALTSRLGVRRDQYAVRLMRTAALVTLLQPHDAAIATGSMGPGVRRDDQWRMALQ